MSLSRLVARPMLASIFVVGGVNALRNAPKLAAKAAPVTDKLAPLAHKAAPQGAAAGGRHQLGTAQRRGPDRRRSRPGHRSSAADLLGALLAATLAPTTAAAHRFWEIDDKEQRTQQQMHFFKNVSLFGGLVIAAGDTDGGPGVAWRARRAAKDARRETRHLAATARREARLAKAQLT